MSRRVLEERRREDESGYEAMNRKSILYTNDQCVGCNRCVKVCSAMGACVSIEEDGKTHIVVDGEETEIPTQQGIAGLYDIRRRGGTVDVAMRSGAVSGRPLLRLGGLVMQLPVPYDVHHYSRCRFVSGSDRPLLRLSYIRTDGSRQDVLWDRLSPVETLPVQARALDWYVEDAGVGYVAVTESRALIRPPGGSGCELPGRYRFYSEACGGLFGGKLYAVLTGLDGTQSVLWKDGEAEPVALRGYLSGVFVREEVIQSSQ